MSDNSTKTASLQPGAETASQWPFRAEMRGHVSVRGVIIPHNALSSLLSGGRLTRLVQVRAGSPLGSLLGAAFDVAITKVPLLSPELGDAVLQNLCRLVPSSRRAARLLTTPHQKPNQISNLLESDV